ncbi:MAG: hypothetical protein K6A23_16365, partial [Butyrivibrio sp.]|nr:hypothetical protein [Butyrivibrio sp.]
MIQKIKRLHRHFWNRIYLIGCGIYRIIQKVLRMVVTVPSIINIFLGGAATCWFLWNYIFEHNPYDPLESHPVYTFFLFIAVNIILPPFMYAYVLELLNTSIFKVSLQALMGVASGWLIAGLLNEFAPNIELFHNIIMDYSVLSILSGIFLKYEDDDEIKTVIGPAYSLDFWASIPFAIAVAFIVCEYTYPTGKQNVDYQVIINLALKSGAIAGVVYYVSALFIQRLRLIAASVE